MKMFWGIISKSLLNWRCVTPTALYPKQSFHNHNQIKHTLFALGKSKCWVVLSLPAFTGLEIDLEVCLELSSNSCEISKPIVLSLLFLPFLRMGATVAFSQLTGTSLNHHHFPQIKASSLMHALWLDTAVAFWQWTHKALLVFPIQSHIFRVCLMF